MFKVGDKVTRKKSAGRNAGFYPGEIGTITKVGKDCVYIQQPNGREEFHLSESIELVQESGQKLKDLIGKKVIRTAPHSSGDASWTNEPAVVVSVIPQKDEVCIKYQGIYKEIAGCFSLQKWDDGNWKIYGTEKFQQEYHAPVIISCNHDWKVTPGFTAKSFYKDCTKCGAKWEDLYPNKPITPNKPI